ncbi:MAG: Ig-like domain-containing protein, partial [Muribaculaceae bacterium]|nr:Ig-like domain-containing protein [Muribaculaceae bacterium]
QYKPVNYVTLPGDRNDSEPKNYRLIKPEDEESPFVVYVPEYRILSDYSRPQQPRSDRPVLNIKFKGVDQIYQLEFKYYSDEVAAEDGARKDDYFDIRRNFIYHYNVRLTGSGLAWDVDVLPYTSVELKPNFGLLLANLTLNKYVSKLYTDQAGETLSQDLLIAYDESNKQVSARKVTWRLSESITRHVCTVTKNADGTCTVKPIAKATGRDIVEAVIIDKNGFEVIAECIIEVTERHLGLEKTFLGLIPKNILPAYSSGSFRVNIVAERDKYSTLSWKLVDSNDQPLSPELQDLVTVTAEGDGGALGNGDCVSEKNIIIHVQANNQGKLGDVHLLLIYTGPDPKDSSKRREYSTYCDISVSNVSLTVYPTVLNLTVGQQSSVTARTAPVFSDYIPALAFESENTDVVTVDDNGLVTAVGQGSTRIKVTSPDDLLNWIAPEYVEVNVVPDDLVLLRSDGLPADYVELLSGEKLTLKAFSHGVDVSKTAVWDVVDASFLTIKNGVITAGDNAGTSTVRASYTVNGVTYSETCIVAVATERKLIIADCPKGISEYGSVPMKAYVFPDSTPYDQRDYTVTWTSSNEKIIAFDDPTDKSIAVAKNSGTATLTASTMYKGQALTASVKIDVLGHDEDLKPEFHLYIYDAKGNRVATITSEYVSYSNNTNVGKVNNSSLFNTIDIPEGQTWTAEVDFTYGPKEPNISCKWEKYIRYNFHGDRIEITPSGKKCKIKTKTLPAAQHLTNRYNEVYISFEYNGVKYTRAFCVYTKY